MSSGETTGEAASKPQPPQAQAVRTNDEESERLCNKWVGTGLANNNAIRFLIQQLEDLGCAPPQGFVACRQCEQPQASGFGKVVVAQQEGDQQEGGSDSPSCGPVIRDFQSALDLQKKQRQEQQQGDSAASSSSTIQLQPEIFVCQQYMDSEVMTHKTMVHELIHAIDLCRTKMDPVNNCLHLACTEIRAENLSGECGFWKELPRMTKHGFAGHGRECVQRRALLSVRANPKCAARAKDYVEATLPRCYTDYYPFERHPNQFSSSDKVS